MNTEDGPTPDTANESAGRSAVAELIESLRRRLGDVPTKTALPEQLEATVRQVRPDIAAGPRAGRTDRPVTGPPGDIVVDASPAADFLSQQFVQAATSIGANVHSATTADWPDVVVRLLQEHRVQTVATPRAGDGFFDANRIEQLRQRLAADDLTARSETDDETLFSVGAAVTGVAAAIAESGSLACRSGSATARGSSLIPLVHIAVVGRSQLVADLYDYFERLGAESSLPAQAILISGPSKTADIEGILVTGVHGPGHVHAILVRDA